MNRRMPSEGPTSKGGIPKAPRLRDRVVEIAEAIPLKRGMQFALPDAELKIIRPALAELGYEVDLYNLKDRGKVCAVTRARCAGLTYFFLFVSPGQDQDLLKAIYLPAAASRLRIVIDLDDDMFLGDFPEYWEDLWSKKLNLDIRFVRPDRIIGIERADDAASAAETLLAVQRAEEPDYGTDDEPKLPVLFVGYGEGLSKDSIDEVHTYLDPLRPQCSIWSPRQVGSGHVVTEEVRTDTIRSASIVVLLVTQQYINDCSDELTLACELAANGSLRLYWLLVDSASYRMSSLGGVTPAHDVDNPLSGLPRSEREEVLTSVVGAIADALPKD